jgi:MFS family permease
MTRNVRLLYLHNFLTYFRFQEAFVVIYFAQIVGSYASAMTVVALSTVVAAVLDIPMGLLSDRFGRRNTIIFGSICSAISVILYAMSSNMLGLCSGAIFSGLCRALFNGNNNALLFESLKTEGREADFPHSQGRAGSMFQLALGLSALAASLFAKQGLHYVFIAGIFPQLLAVLVSFFFVEPSKHYASNVKNSFGHFVAAINNIRQNPRLRLLIVGQSISHGVGESTFSFVDAFINTVWPTWAVGVYRALNHGCGFLGFWFAGKIVKKIKGPYMLVIAEVYWFVVQTVAALISNVISPVLILSGASLFGPFIVARDQLLQEDFTDEQRATMGSITSFGGSLVFALNAYCLGIVSDHWGLIIGLLFGTFVGVLSLPIYIALFRKKFTPSPKIAERVL